MDPEVAAVVVEAVSKASQDQSPVASGLVVQVTKLESAQHCGCRTALPLVLVQPLNYIDSQNYTYDCLGAIPIGDKPE